MAFQKCGLPFLCFRYYRGYKELRLDFDSFGFLIKLKSERNS